MSLFVSGRKPDLCPFAEKAEGDHHPTAFSSAFAALDAAAEAQHQRSLDAMSAECRVNRLRNQDGKRTAKLRGVSMAHGKGRWRASIKHKRRTGDRQVCLGTFDTQEQAAFAYDAALYLLREELQHTERSIFDAPNSNTARTLSAVAVKLGITYGTQPAPPWCLKGNT